MPDDKHWHRVHALLADPGLRAAGEGTCCWAGAPIESKTARFRRRWAGYRRFPKPRISARSSSDRPPQIPYGSRVRNACCRHSSRTGQSWQIALARSILRCFCRLRSLAGWKNISTSMPLHVAASCQFHSSEIGSRGSGSISGQSEQRNGRGRLRAPAVDAGLARATHLSLVQHRLRPETGG